MSLDAAITGELAKRLIERRHDTIEQLATGIADDFSKYRYSCGYIKALDDVAAICNEILTDMQKR